jgi:hypothetical protein
MDKAEKYKDFDVMLPQGARSRFTKAVTALDEAESLLPEDALDGTKTDLVLVIRRLEVATANLNELLAYRKMLGVD